MYSDNGFWRKFTERLEALQKRKEISEEDFILVRYDADLLLKVHELSVDRGMEFTDKDVFEIVDHVKNKLTEEKQRQLNDIAKSSELEINTLKAVISDKDVRWEITKSRVDKVSRYLAISISLLVCGVLAVCVFWAFYLTLPIDKINNQVIQKYRESFLTVAALTVTAIFGLIATIFGCDIISVYRWAQRKIMSWIHNILLGDHASS